MAILNRDLAPSQQCRVVDKSLAATATGVTAGVLCLVECPSQVVAGAVRAFGLSGAPVHSINVIRVNAGGITTLGLGATVTLTDGLATYAQGISFSLGATVLLQTGDLLVVNSGAANTAVTGAQYNLVLKALQDVKTFDGVSL